MALAKAIVANHGQHVTAALAAAVERLSSVTRSASSPMVSVSASCTGTIQAQCLERLTGAELVGIERNTHFRLGERKRRDNGAVRLGGKLFGRQAEAPARRKEYFPLVATHIGLEQLACAKMWMVDNLLFHWLVHCLPR